MRQYLIALATATAVSGLCVPSQAAPVAPEGIRAAIDGLAVTENIQFMWEGHRYCWYPAGWQGPGWYRCGYSMRRGLGWGGPMGWQGWSIERGPRLGRGENNERRMGRRNEGKGDRIGAEGGATIRGGTTGTGGIHQPALGNEGYGPSGGNAGPR